MRRIAIVGAGLSGRLLALNLVRQAPSTVSLTTIDRGDARYMGPAYSDEADHLLLNVPAGRMGAFSGDPEHFLKWARQKGIRADQWAFLPRRAYRDYVLELVRDAQRDRAGGPLPLEHVRGEATDIALERDGATVHTEAGRVAADKVVLALGNFFPRDPPVRNRSALDSRRYVRNPWDPGVLGWLSGGETVLLIGTGQTTVDLAIALGRRAHQGRIVAVSRHGLLPLAHRDFEAYPSFFEEIKDFTSVLDIFRTVRRHLERAESRGIDRRAVIDSLRPDTQSLWMGLSADEKRRFLRHVFRYWEIVRSRIPPESDAVIRMMRASGQLEIVTGRIRDLAETGAAMEVHYTTRGGTTEVETAAVVINCIGPESDYGRIDHPLVQNLMRRGLIRPGPARLGMDATPGGAIIASDGAVSSVLYTLGSTMKGVLWEVLAVPEIRAQAERLAHTLLEGASAGPSSHPRPGVQSPVPAGTSLRGSWEGRRGERDADEQGTSVTREGRTS